jgi:transposase
MPRSRPPYPPEFREQIVALVRAGRSPESLAKEFEPSAPTIRHWVALAGDPPAAAPGAAGALSSAERDELARLRREVKQLKTERDILGKAAAWFARETGTLPSASGS